MTDQQLQESFAYCQRINDPEQWDFLALAYYQRGYYLNALVCFRKADECRLSVNSSEGNHRG